MCLCSLWQFISPWIFIFSRVSPSCNVLLGILLRRFFLFLCCTRFIVPLGPALSSPNFLGVCPCVPEIQTPKRCFHASSFVPILWDWILSWRTSCFFMCRGKDMECLSYCWLLFFLLRLSFWAFWWFVCGCWGLNFFLPFRYLLKQIFLSFNNSTDFVRQESLHLF